MKKLLSAHQPNFMPYPGYILKMYLSDVFAFSDLVDFTSRVHHQYNYFVEEGALRKVSVPIGKRSGPMNGIPLADYNRNKIKLIKRLSQNYSKTPFFSKYFPDIEDILMAEHSTLIGLNIALLEHFHSLYKLDCKLVLESDLGVTGPDATHEIVDICKKTGCDGYLSGDFGVNYLKREVFSDNGIELMYVNYKPIQYGSLPNASIFDHLMKVGPVIPYEWKRRKEQMRSWQNKEN